jgi:adenylate cyclase
MPEDRAQRRLAAILAADVVGYSRLMQLDEAGTLVALKTRLREVLQPAIARHRGRIVKVMGDGVLVEFASAVDAVECAVALQEAMDAANHDIPDDRRIVLRIGINLGDVMVEGQDLYGDGVNIAARLEALADAGSVFISQTVFIHVKGKANLDFEDLGERSLKNMAEPVRVYRLSGPATLSTSTVTARDDLPSKPSIAVLPFVNMSGDPEQEFFVDGLTEDIITALSRISALRVIARTSTLTYKGKPEDVKRIAKELGVRYVMEGSARRSGERLRITAQLIEAATGHHIWAERYDCPMADLFEVQDDITRSVVGTTERQVNIAEGEAGQSRHSTDVTASDLASRAWARMYEETPEASAEAYILAEEAIDIDPLNPLAHRARAAAFFSRLWFGEIPHDASNMARAMELARTAQRLAPRDEYTHLVMSWAYAYAETGKLEEAVAECERGLAINPNNSGLLGNLGAYLAALGRTQEAVEACRLAIRLDPRADESFAWHSSVAIAHFAAASYDTALQESKKVVRSRSHLSSALIWAAAAAALGKPEEARAAVECCIAQRPDLTVGTVVPRFFLRFARNEDHERLVTLLRKAGLPE